MPNIAYGLGNAFSNIGYRAQSYHDWTYTYYGRQKYMKNLGFDNYKGCNVGDFYKLFSINSVIFV